MICNEKTLLCVIRRAACVAARLSIEYCLCVQLLWLLLLLLPQLTHTICDTQQSGEWPKIRLDVAATQCSWRSSERAAGSARFADREEAELFSCSMPQMFLAGVALVRGSPCACASFPSRVRVQQHFKGSEVHKRATNTDSL